VNLVLLRDGDGAVERLTEGEESLIAQPLARLLGEIHDLLVLDGLGGGAEVRLDRDDAGHVFFSCWVEVEEKERRERGEWFTHGIRPIAPHPCYVSARVVVRLDASSAAVDVELSRFDRNEVEDLSPTGVRGIADLDVTLEVTASEHPRIRARVREPELHEIHPVVVLAHLVRVERREDGRSFGNLLAHVHDSFRSVDADNQH